jgi:hypothetical protein
MSNELKTLLITIAKRYARAFMAGGIASLASFFAVAQFSPDVLKDPLALVISITTAFLAGGLMSIDKLTRWQDTPSNNS